MPRYLRHTCAQTRLVEIRLKELIVACHPLPTEIYRVPGKASYSRCNVGAPASGAGGYYRSAR